MHIGILRYWCQDTTAEVMEDAHTKVGEDGGFWCSVMTRMWDDVDVEASIAEAQASKML